MNLDLWFCEAFGPGGAQWVSESDVSIPFGVRCRPLTRGTHSHNIASRVIRWIEKIEAP